MVVPKGADPRPHLDDRILPHLAVPFAENLNKKVKLQHLRSDIYNFTYAVEIYSGLTQMVKC